MIAQSKIIQNDKIDQTKLTKWWMIMCNATLVEDPNNQYLV